MTTETVVANRSEKSRIAWHAASVLSALLVLAGVYGPFFVTLPTAPYEFDTGTALRGALALVGLLGLVLLSSRRSYTVTVLVLTGVAGAIALGLLGFGMLIAWTAGVHSFASSWGPIGGTFALLSPFFAPPIAAGLILWMRNLARWTKCAVVVAVVGGSCVFSIFARLGG